VKTRSLQLQRWISQYAFREILPLRGEAGVISFSFDDAPKSACVLGRELLEQYDCHGTWYIAGGLTDQLEMGRPCHSVQDVQGLVSAGHHIGCHTFSHRPCDQLSSIEMANEITRNAAFLDAIGVPSSELHFSFPLGAFDLASKRMAAQRFVSTRTTSGGAHFGTADLHALRAEKLYQHLMMPARVASLAKEVAEKKGWLIFYTHDVTENPSEWGCTPELLKCAITTALAMGCKVLPVNQAIRYWADGP
jgi:peptidoglycan/xylan/chitin deacetylase (PgdA/CDA1 family)